MLINNAIVSCCATSVLVVALASGPAWGGHLEPFAGAPDAPSNPGTVEKIELGKMLFFDRRLSGDGTMSCATCHIPALGFGDGQAIGLNYPTTRNWRNTQTLINVANQKFLFHDGRVSSLEDQALFPIMSAFEMNQNLDFLEEEIRAVPAYVDLFREVFGDDDVTRERIAMALAAFERTLISRNSPLDRFLDGEKNAVSPEARRGMEIFTGKGKCADCHFGVALIDDRFHALDVPEHPDFQGDPRITATRRFVAKVSHYEDFRTLDEDPGRYLVTKDKADWRAFRTPTLRDIARTDPYMHNGIFDTLEEVIDFLDRGESPALTPLNLTAVEKSDLKACLEEALTGEEIIVKTPKIP
jgi:cytochrome c peroxidase